jgi:hypothetical protein
MDKKTVKDLFNEWNMNEGVETSVSYTNFVKKYGDKLAKKMHNLKQIRGEYPPEIHAKFKAIRGTNRASGNYTGNEINKIADAYDAKLLGITPAMMSAMKEDWKDVQAGIDYNIRGLDPRYAGD